MRLSAVRLLYSPPGSSGGRIAGAGGFPALYVLWLGGTGTSGTSGVLWRVSLGHRLMKNYSAFGRTEPQQAVKWAGNLFAGVFAPAQNKAGPCCVISLFFLSFFKYLSD